jgi:hypothetical protein
MVLKTGGASPLLLKKIEKTQAKIMSEKHTYEEPEHRIQELEQAESKRKSAEKALRESVEKYRSMMDGMTDPAYICSHDFRIEYMRRTTRKQAAFIPSTTHLLSVPMLRHRCFRFFGILLKLN